ncbi:Uncharacterised protein [Actinomyces bovis]|uniref:VWFA domain-containing protein n=1 Tax=Actinomyces bovis TaxID=1658 RepID=A0ABY1VMF8_9ACTO|nr:VWA domain-containing protein [Actinomyces bovis]SPT52942.1 Uncharacterised protein [Actinomyces bovis]VEG55123.1 Uncharacterised protein [Actinomyces israelii]
MRHLVNGTGTQPTAVSQSAIRRTRRQARRRLLGLLSATCIMASSLLVWSPQSQADEQKSNAQSGLAEFGACLAGQGQGSLLLLMDQSGSLNTTDPHKSRVTSAKYLTGRLNEFTKRTGFKLDVRVAGFAANYAPQGDWATLSDSTRPTVESAITTVGDDIKDYDTDYWTALEGARQDLSDHAAGGCKAITWFSDGAFDLDLRDTDAAKDKFGTTKPYAPGASLTTEAGVTAAEQQGTQDLCRSTGLADQLRSSNITLLGVGLSTGGADFGLMRRVVSGGGVQAAETGVEACGGVSKPRGSFYEVADIDSLLLAFDSISAPGSQVSQSQVKICQGKVCEEGETSFVLDGTLPEVHVLATADVAGLEAQLIAPGASSPLVLPSETKGAQNQQGVRSEWLTDKTLQIDLAAKDVTTWDGQWRLAFVDKKSGSQGQEVHINTHLSSPLTLAWKNLAEVTLRQGEKTENAQIALLERSGGAALEASRVKGSVTYAVVLEDSQGTQHKLLESTDLSQLSQPQSFQVPAEAALGKGAVITSATVTTAAVKANGKTIEGTTLAPTLASVPVTVNPPLDFPVLGQKVDFGRLEKQNQASMDLSVTGPGCVWLEAKDVTLTGAPAEAGTITVSAQASSPDTCVSVDEAATGSLPLTLSTTNHANGAVTGALKVTVAPKDHPERAQQVEVPFTADMRRPLNVGTAWSTFVLVLLAGVAIPVVLLYLFRFLAGRVPAGSLVSGVKVVEVPEPGHAASISFQPQELQSGSVAKASRQIDVNGYRLQVRLGWSPTSVPRVRLVSPEALTVCGGPDGSSTGRDTLPLAVRGSWMAIADQLDSPKRVSLLVLSAYGDQEAIDRITADAAERLGRAVADAFPQPNSPEQTGSPEGPTNPFGSAGGASSGAAIPAGNPFAAGTSAPTPNPFAAGSGPMPSPFAGGGTSGWPTGPNQTN